ncbi:hypothetical protein RclHR1_04470013 [Rhizophagus clarus]|uniref:Uncharacterized protein n=1 Tax=Rhizophagus clarus TaxID=94130 RepID=A0A2Z6RIV9_9GLOM|nr:hypothetical protein RclHR1_04470013 [Rhizophagus clarus]
MSSITKVTPITTLKSIPSNCFHDIIVDFISGLIKRNPSTIFSSIITTDLLAINEFLSTYKEQMKRSAKKKARKEKQKLQLQSPSGLDEQVVFTFSMESLEYTPSKPSGSRTVTFNQNNGKKLKQKETDNTLKNGNVIITGYFPQDQEQVHKKYLSARVRLISDHKCLKCYNGGDWTVNLGGIPVRWFPAFWNFLERKQQEKFQTVVYNLPEDMMNASLFPNGRLHQFLLDSGIKSFKIVKEIDGSKKLIGYFDTWDHVSTCINNPQLWNDIRLSWCCYSTLNFKNLRKSARIGNAKKSFRTPNGSNFSFSGLNTNNCKNDYNKTPKSGRSTKKIDHSRNDQSKKPDVKHLIAGLKVLLEYYV